MITYLWCSFNFITSLPCIWSFFVVNDLEINFFSIHLLHLCIWGVFYRVLWTGTIQTSVLQDKHLLPWQQYSPLHSNATDHQDLWGWYHEEKGGWGRGGGGVAKWTEWRQHGQVEQVQRMRRDTSRESRRPGLLSARKIAPRRRQTVRSHQETGRHRSGWGGSMSEEDRMSGNGGTTPLGPGGTGLQVKAGRGKEWFDEWRWKEETWKD